MMNDNEPLDARTLANRRNALKSTGPKTPEGKRRSSMNALKHGLTAKTAVLPGEDGAAFDDRLDAWFDEFQPEGASQVVSVEHAVHATWRLDRCAKVETARLEARVECAGDDSDRKALDDADFKGADLVDDPVEHGYTVNPRDPETRAALDARWLLRPAPLARALKSTAEGVDWLLARWEELACALDTYGYWHFAEKFKAVRLLGRTPEDV